MKPEAVKRHFPEGQNSWREKTFGKKSFPKGLTSGGASRGPFWGALGNSGNLKGLYVGLQESKIELQIF
jgi:hypothetical protein